MYSVYLYQVAYGAAVLGPQSKSRQYLLVGGRCENAQVHVCVTVTVRTDAGTGTQRAVALQMMAVSLLRPPPPQSRSRSPRREVLGEVTL